MFMFTKNEIKARAKLSRGLVSVLKDDVEMLIVDADDFNLYTIGESIKEMRDTLQDIMENLNELEYAVIIAKEKLS